MLVIIPFYNEEKRISKKEYNFLFTKFKQEKFLLVNDASTDKTLKILNNFKQLHSNVSVFTILVNVGKAEAIRQALLQSDTTEANIAYIDADLATPMEELYKMNIFQTENPNYNFIMGSRIKRLGSIIKRYTYRHYLGRFFATIVSSGILKTPVYDTQCGAKIIEKKLAFELFKNPFLTRWLFDLELLLRYKKLKPNFDKFIYEFPLQVWIEKGNSKIKFTDFIKFPFQLIKIYYYYAK